MYMKGHGVEHISLAMKLPENQVRELIGLETVIIKQKISNPKKPSKMKNQQRVITDAQREKVIELKNQGYTHREIKKRVRISLASIDRIVNKRPSRARTVKKASQTSRPAAKQTHVNQKSRRSRFSLFWGAIEIVKEA
jgi:hypothetical protein